MYIFLQQYWWLVVSLLGAILVYYIGYIWRSFLRFFPLVLQYQFRRCILALDDYTFQFCIAGCQL